MRWQMRPYLVLLALTLCLSGCVSVFEPMPEPPTETRELLQQLPPICRSKVYVIMVNGNDPLCLGGMVDLRDYIKKMGITNIYLGETCHEAWLDREIRILHRDIPDAHFVLIGFEYGADTVRRIAQAGIDAGATIDMLIYLEPKGLSFCYPPEEPKLLRTITIQNEGWLHHKEVPEDSELIPIETHCIYEAPTHSATIDLVTSELVNLAMSVPYVHPELPKPVPLLDQVAPPPRPYVPEKAKTKDEWDFLKRQGEKPILEPVVPKP